MKLKKILKILSPYETVRVWDMNGSNMDPLYYGEVRDLPKRFFKYQLVKNDEMGEDSGYFDIRYDNSDIEDHVAISVIKE